MISVLIRVRQNGLRLPEIYTDTFEHADGLQTEEVEKAMREAIAEFLATSEGKECSEGCCDDFNWGDAVTEVPDEIWAKHGLRLENSVKGHDIIVDQDEVFHPTDEPHSEKP